MLILVAGIILLGMGIHHATLSLYFARAVFRQRVQESEQKQMRIRLLRNARRVSSVPAAGLVHWWVVHGSRQCFREQANEEYLSQEKLSLVHAVYTCVDGGCVLSSACSQPARVARG